MHRRPLIAVVDDDESVCKALARLLRSCRMDALTYSSARDFFDNGASRHPDCMVLDIQMPGMTGLELRDQLKTQGENIPVIFITAHDDAEFRAKALSGGSSIYLNKPFNEADLLAAIDKAVEGVGPRETGAER